MFFSISCKPRIAVSEIAATDISNFLTACKITEERLGFTFIEKGAAQFEAGLATQKQQQLENQRRRKELEQKITKVLVGFNDSSLRLNDYQRQLNEMLEYFVISLLGLFKVLENEKKQIKREEIQMRLPVRILEAFFNNRAFISMNQGGIDSAYSRGHSGWGDIIEKCNICLDRIIELNALVERCSQLLLIFGLPKSDRKQSLATISLPAPVDMEGLLDTFNKGVAKVGLRRKSIISKKDYNNIYESASPTLNRLRRLPISNSPTILK
jgi:hypothetical protein